MFNIHAYRYVRYIKLQCYKVWSFCFTTLQLLWIYIYIGAVLWWLLRDQHINSHVIEIGRYRLPFLPWGRIPDTVYPKKYAHGFVVLCFVVVMQSFIMNPHELFIHIHQGCFAGTGAIVRLPQCQWSKPVGYGKISQCITTTKHSKAKTMCIFLGIYCTCTISVSRYVDIYLCLLNEFDGTIVKLHGGNASKN